MLVPEKLVPIIAKHGDIVEKLLPDLPEERRTPEELYAFLHSPQLQQAIRTFASALETGQMNHLLRQIGVEGLENILREGEKTEKPDKMNM